MDRSEDDFQYNVLDQLEAGAHVLSSSVTEARLALQQAQTNYDRVVGELSELHDQLSFLRASLSKRPRPTARIMQVLPSELLCMIFIEVIRDLRGAFWDSWEADDPDEDACVALRRAPLAMAGVCRRWHGTALGTPFLWSTIAFSLHRFADGPRLAPYVALFLERSSPSAVDIAMDWEALDWAATLRHRELRLLLQHLEAAASRWRRFRMVIPSKLATEGRDVFNIFRHVTPLLEEFHISGPDDMGGTFGRRTFHEEIPQYLPHCPRLATLCVIHCRVIPFRQLAFAPALEYLHLACFLPCAVICRLLSMVPGLVRLHLALQYEPTTEDEEAVREFTIHLPRLQYFACDHYTDYLLTLLNGRICMPVLNSLDLLNADLSQISEFLPHFKDSPITSLLIKLQVAEVYREHAEAFSALPSVRHLTIDASIMGDFFSKLHASEALPLLQTLTIKARGPSSECDFGDPDDPLAEALLDFVRARTSPQTTVLPMAMHRRGRADWSASSSPTSPMFPLG